MIKDKTSSTLVPHGLSRQDQTNGRWAQKNCATLPTTNEGNHALDVLKMILKY